MKEILEKISTRPNKNAYVWNGYRSILAAVLLYALWVCRVLSLLQISKFIVRSVHKCKWVEKYGLSRLRGSRDYGSKRGNISPAFQERYFLIWLAVIFLVWRLDLQHGFVPWLEGYYVFESTVWILYYTIFRRFFEEKYSIYHPLEHLIIIIVILPTQALALADLYDASFRDAMLAIIGAGDGLPTWVSILGTVYFAVTVSMIISNFPTETKKAGRHHVIIGSGQVVEQRLLPALLKSNVQRNQVTLLSRDKDRQICGVTVRDITGQEEKLLSEEASDQTIFWIETPSYAHMYYVHLLLPQDTGLIVVEKPATVLPEELRQLQRIAGSEHRSKLFFLSYYMLEKALPLVHLNRRLPFYERYLDCRDWDNLWENYRGLGDLREIHVSIREGMDDRTWVSDLRSGGHLLETFVHNMLIATEFAGLPETWDVSELKQENGAGNWCRIKLSARANGVGIFLTMVKNDPKYDKNMQRNACLEFENGIVRANFDTGVVTLEDRKKRVRASLSTKQAFREKYQIQVDMVNRCFSEKLDPNLIDGLENQPQVLQWLMNRKVEVEQRTEEEGAASNA